MAATTFYPIPQLNRTDADVLLMFLGQNISYTSVVNDPWFLGTQPQSVPLFGTEPAAVYYYPAKPVSIIGCTEQHQLRNPTTQKSSALRGAEVISREQAESLGFTKSQLAVFDRSFLTATGYIVPIIAINLGPSNMLAQRYVSEWGVSAALPDNQWVLEFSHWFGTALTSMQVQSLQYAIGQSEDRFNQYIQPVPNDEKWMCNNQIIRRNDYISFSILGLAIILSIGGLLIVSNAFLSLMVGKMQDSSERGRYRNAEWQSYGVLQLLRMTYQHLGIGHWDGQDSLVPFTTDGTKFTLPSTAMPQDHRSQPSSSLSMDNSAAVSGSLRGVQGGEPQNGSILTSKSETDPPGRQDDLEANTRPRLAHLMGRNGSFPGYELQRLISGDY